MNKKDKDTYIEYLRKKHKKEKEELIRKYEIEKEKIIKDYEDLLKYNLINVIDTMQVEFIYELSNQMNYWNMKENSDQDIYYKKSAKYRIEEIYHNIFKTMNNYSKMKNDKQVQKVFKMKKNKIRNEFDLKIEE